MTTGTLLTVEQYVKLPGEYPPEYVHGELIERSMPKWLHSRLQHLLSVRLHQVGLLCAPELHLRLSEDVIRIADLAVFRNPPLEEIPTAPPLLVVEIVSPDDRHQELLRKLEQYLTWGCANIWVVEPELRKFHVYHAGGLAEVHQFELGEFGFLVTAHQLFAEAT